MWAISTTEYAITCHVQVEDLARMEELKRRLKEVLAHEGVDHSTLEFEDRECDCKETECDSDNSSVLREGGIAAHTVAIIDK